MAVAERGLDSVSDGGCAFKKLGDGQKLPLRGDKPDGTGVPASALDGGATALFLATHSGLVGKRPSLYGTLRDQLSESGQRR